MYDYIVVEPLPKKEISIDSEGDSMESDVIIEDLDSDDGIVYSAGYHPHP